MTLVQSIYGILRGPVVSMQFVHTDEFSMTLAGTFELRFEISTSLDRQRVTLPLSLFKASPAPTIIHYVANK